MNAYHKFPVLPDLPDKRDIPYAVPDALTRQPSVISWRSHYPEVWNQGQIGSCTAQTVCGALTYFNPGVDPSRLFQYYNERVRAGDVNADSGSTVRNAIKTAVTCGVCPEAVWPYDAANIFTKPSEVAYSQDKVDVLSTYYRIAPQDGENTLLAIQNAVAIGQPVAIGVAAFEGLEAEATAQTGVVPMPTVSEAPIGGHAILITGYDKEKELFQFRNSWGIGWGDNGYGYFPYQYLLEYLASCWVITGAVK